MTRLYWRLLLWFCAANVVTLLVSVLVTQHIARQLYQHETDWQAIAQQTVSMIDPQTREPRTAIRPWREQLRRRRIGVGLIDDGGRMLLKPPRIILRHLAQLQDNPAVTLHPRPSITLVGLEIVGSNGKNWHFFAAQFTPPSGRRHLWLPFLIEILVSLLVIGAVGWRVARSISRPIYAVQGAARRMADGDLGSRVAAPLTDRRDELGQLARDFDHMASRVQSLVERQRSVLQDVSHEFRSPLARLGVALELARSDAGGVELPSLDRAEREIGRLDRLIGEVLELARMEDQLPGMARQPFDPAELAQERLDEAQPEAAAHQVDLRLDAATGTVVDGSRALLGRAIDNLLSNAIKFSAAGGSVILRTQHSADEVVIEVADSGPGVPAAELDSLFRPFFRGSNAVRAEGKGLGLAIVARIAAAHGGRCSARNRTAGGLCVTLTLPLSRPADAAA